MPNQWRFTEWWVPPHLYEAVTDENGRQVIKNQFFRGMYIAKVGDIVVEIDEREVTEEWTVCTVNRGEKIIERPICADNVPIQRAINDLMGMALETILRAITQTIVDNTLVDREAMSTREALPSEMILTALPVDGDLNKRIFQFRRLICQIRYCRCSIRFGRSGRILAGFVRRSVGGPSSQYLS